VAGYNEIILSTNQCQVIISAWSIYSTILTGRCTRCFTADVNSTVAPTMMISSWMVMEWRGELETAPRNWSVSIRWLQPLKCSSLYIPAASGVMHKATDLSSTSLAQFTLVYKRVNSANIGSPCTAEY